MSKKERLVELLGEKRTALISRAVTKGLDPNVPMKDSGVKWLGEIPAHWNVKRTKYVARLESGHTPSRQHPEYWVDCDIQVSGLQTCGRSGTGPPGDLPETSEKVSEVGIASSAARLLRGDRDPIANCVGRVFCDHGKTDGDDAGLRHGPAGKKIFRVATVVCRSMGHEFRRLTMGSTHQTYLHAGRVAMFSTRFP